MKYVKILGVMAIAVMALMAVGASPASATKLCTDSACTSVYAAGEEIKAEMVSGSSTTLTGSNQATIATCTGSTVSGKTINREGVTVSANISSLTWGGCSQTTHTVSTGQIYIAYTSGANGTVSGAGSQVTFGIFGVSCTYGTGEGTHLGTITGGTAPILKIATTVNKTAGGFLCPATAGWDAEYVVTAPHALYVGS